MVIQSSGMHLVAPLIALAMAGVPPSTAEGHTVRNNADLKTALLAGRIDAGTMLIDKPELL